MENSKNTTVVNHLRKLLASDYYPGFSKTYITSRGNHEKDLTALHMPEGFISFKTESDISNSHLMQDAGRTLEVANPEPVRKANPKYIESRARRRYKNKSIKLWNNLTDSHNGDCEIDHENYAVKCKLSKDVSAVCSEQFREEYYLPFAFFKDGIPEGGCYLHISEAGTAEQLSKLRENLQGNKFKEVFTGGCLFGSTLYGIDQNGKRHSMTSPYTEIHGNSVIQSIECPYDLHPDEILTRESLINLIPLIKVCSDKNVKLRYHLPTANYFIYGINWYLKNKISKDALTVYFKHVIERSASHKKFLNKLSRKVGLEINAYSTLDAFEMEKSSPESIFDDFIQRIGVDGEKQSAQNLFDAAVIYLAENSHPAQCVWRHLKNCIDNFLFEVDSQDLLSLNYMDYSANIAAASQNYSDREVLSLLPSHESPVSHWYKKILAAEFGAVSSIQWLSPVQFNIEDFRYRSFYIDSYVEDLNELLNLGLIRKSFLQTAATALDSPTFFRAISEDISRILAIQEESILIREQKALLSINSNSTLPATAI